MTPVEFKELLEDCRWRRDIILFGKGMEYSGNQDKVSNFKRVAEMVGLSPMQVWAIYFLKHVFSIMNYVSTGKESSEGMEGRFDDAANYIDLGWALYKDLKEGANSGEDTRPGPRICGTCGCLGERREDRGGSPDEHEQGLFGLGNSRTSKG